VPEPASTRNYEFHPEAEEEFLAELDRLHAMDPYVAADFNAEVYASARLLLEPPPWILALAAQAVESLRKRRPSARNVSTEARGRRSSVSRSTSKRPKWGSKPSSHS
jgi:hypothetical protein